MMSKRLTQEERMILNQIIHSSDLEWWNIIEDEAVRSAALNELLRLQFIEIDMSKGMVRATDRGVKSNQRAKAHNLV